MPSTKPRAIANLSEPELRAVKAALELAIEEGKDVVDDLHKRGDERGANKVYNDYRPARSALGKVMRLLAG